MTRYYFLFTYNDYECHNPANCKIFKSLSAAIRFVKKDFRGKQSIWRHDNIDIFDVHKGKFRLLKCISLAVNPYGYTVRIFGDGKIAHCAEILTHKPSEHQSLPPLGNFKIELIK